VLVRGLKWSLIGTRSFTPGAYCSNWVQQLAPQQALARPFS
jgi:hypothetical protein